MAKPGLFPPTLIIGATPRVVVPLARCLARHGVPVVAASLMPDTPEMRSRALLGYRYLRPPALSPETFRADLRGMIEEYGVDTVIPTGDEVLSALALHEAEWRERVHLLCPPASTFRRVLDKSETLAVAETQAVPIPQTRTLVETETLDASLEGFRFPAIVKPADKGRDIALRLRYVDSRPELQRLMASRFRPGDAWMLQEYIPGHGVGVEILMHQGEALAVFQHRRLKEYPVAGGVAARCEGEVADPELREHAIRLLRALEWEGVAMVEFRHDPESSRSALMEINGRYWGSVALPLQSGVEFPWYEWQLAHGQTPDIPACKPGRRMRWLAGDLQRLPEAAASVVAREYPLARGLSDTGTFFSDFFDPRTGDALWTWQDPAPALRDLRQASGRVLGQVGDKVARKVLPRRWHEGLRPVLRLGPTGITRYIFLKLTDRPQPPTRAAIHQARDVLFVCHGNIIRSAFAEARTVQKLEPYGTTETVRIHSAGVCAQDGNPAHPDARGVAPRYGLSLAAHRAQQLDPAMVAAADLIFVMDRLNQVRMQQQFPEARQRTFLLGTLDPAGRFADDGQQIRDPYGEGPEAVADCFERLLPCVDALAEALSERKAAP